MNTLFIFTKESLQALPTRHKQYEVRDSKIPGLVLRVNPAGSKTFIFWKKIAGRNLKVKIGRFPYISIDNARKQAAVLNAQCLTGDLLHGVLQPNRTSPTFEQLYQQYYSEHAKPHTKRPADNKQQIENHILPKIGQMRVAAIEKKTMRAIHNEMGQTSGKGQANRMLDMTSAVFAFGLREDKYRGLNPCIGIRRFKRRVRDRFLSQGEIGAFLSALTYEEQIYNDFFMLSILIGARKSAMLAMKYRDIDFDNKRWRLEEDEAKNGEVNIHALADPAIVILERRREDNSSNINSPFVFPGSGKTGHLADPKKAFARVKRRMGTTDLRIHDLRRTLASYMAITNASMPIIAQALNHKSQASTEIYARLSLDPVRAAVNTAATKMLMPKAEIERQVKWNYKQSADMSDYCTIKQC